MKRHIYGCANVDWDKFKERVILQMSNRGYASAYEMVRSCPECEIDIRTARRVITEPAKRRRRSTVEALALALEVSAEYLLFGEKGNNKGYHKILFSGAKDGELSYTLILEDGTCINIDLNQKKEFYLKQLGKLSEEELKTLYFQAVMKDVLVNN